MTSSHPFTLRSAAGLPSKPESFVDSALIVIDAQEEYGSAGALPLEGLTSALAHTARLLERARSLGRPVIHVVHHGAAGGMFDPDAGGRVLADVALDLGLLTLVVGDATATRSLPGTGGGAALPAEAVHRAALAALADRFAVTASTDELV